jgi:hypothetical protein
MKFDRSLRSMSLGRAERKEVARRAESSERTVRAEKTRDASDLERFADRGAISGSEANLSGKGAKAREKRESGEPQDERASRKLVN